MTEPYRYVPGSVVDRTLKALDAAAVPMTAAQLREAIEYTGAISTFLNIIRKPTDMGVFALANRLYTRGDTPTIVRERRAYNGKRPLEQWRNQIQQAAATGASLRALMDTGAEVSTGDPLRALADALDVAREVLAAGRKGERFKGAEVELLVARELRSITTAAQLAVHTLKQALEVLK